MPEALAVLLVFIVSVGVYLAALIQAREAPTEALRVQDRTRRRNQEAWILERLEKARLEGWDSSMISALQAELDAIRRA